MAVRSCIVSFPGERGLRHSVEVTAEAFYEAAAQALSIFKQCEWADTIGPGTELTVTVKNHETTHHVTLDQIRRWCDCVACRPLIGRSRHPLW